MKELINKHLQQLKNSQYWKKAFFVYWPILAFTAILVTSFYPVVFQNRTLVASQFTAGVMGNQAPWGTEREKGYAKGAAHYLDPGASSWQDEPLTEKTAFLYRHGIVPLWNSSMALGKPLAAEMVSAVFFPLKAIVYVFPTPLGWDLFLLSRIFLAMILTYAFLRMIQLGKMSSMIGGVIFGLNGFFMLFIPMVHLNVEILLPLTCIAFEMIMQNRRYGWLVLAGTIFALTTGGHPESSVLVFSLAFVFFLYRLMVEKQRWEKIKQVLLGIAVGSGLSACLILPFLELYQFAYTSHTPEQRLAATYDLPVFFYNILYPYMLGQPLGAWTNIWGGGSGTRLWIGIFSSFFAIASIWSIKRYWRYTPVFLFILCFVLTKQYGLINYDWITYVPIFNLIAFQKYLLPEIGFTLAILAALGYEYLFTHRSLRTSFLILPAAALLITPFFVRHYNTLADTTGYLKEFTHQFIWLALLLVAVLISVVIIEWKKSLSPLVIGMFAVLLVGEMIYLVPKQWPARVDPFAKPPYVEFLQKQGVNRVFGIDYILYPDTASAFQLYDIRDLDAVFVDHYFRYIKEFVNPSIVDRYTGMAETVSKEYLPTQFKDNPFFNLLNVKYLLSWKPLAGSHAFIDDVVTNNEGLIGPPVRLSAFTIKKETMPVLFEHPGAGVDTVLKKKMTPTSVDSRLSFAVAMDPEVWDKGGDGVQFILKVEGETEPLFSLWIDPKQKRKDRKWHPAEIDLGVYAGKEITLEFITSMGPSSNEFDFAGWGGLTFTDFPEPVPQYEMAYNGEIGISENTHAYPRAFLVSNVVTRSTDNDIVAAMKTEGFHPRTTAAVKTTEKTSEEVKATLASLTNATEIPFDATQVTEYKDNKITITTNAPTKSLLVLSDTYYPGWKAYVDGKKTPIYQTDLALRGIVIEQGTHTVEFKYQPWTFRLGALITLLTLAGIGYWLYRDKKRPA